MKTPQPESPLVAALVVQLRALKLPPPVREHRFHPVRKWRFDLAYPAHYIGIECDGGVYTQGRHTRGAGFEADLEKFNAAALLGWAVLRFSRRFIDSGDAVQTVAIALKLKGAA